MIVLNEFPRNKEKFIKLVGFLKEILGICKGLNIQPILNASLAVFVYTRNTEMDVNDIDLLIPESQFPNIAYLLKDHGIEFQEKEYHVLRALKEDLKIDFDSIDYWPKQWGIKLPNNFERVQLQGLEISIIDLSNLIHTYWMGAKKSSTRSEDYRAKYESLEAIAEQSQNRARKKYLPAGRQG